MTSEETAKYIISNSGLMTIATANAKGKPWVSPVGFSVDELGNLYWVSHKDAVHSQNVRQRPEVAIVIVGKDPDGNMDGVYFDAVATELNNEDDLPSIIELVDSRNKLSKYIIGSVANVTGEAAWRIYKATPKQAWKRSEGIQNEQAITIREKVELGL